MRTDIRSELAVIAIMFKSDKSKNIWMNKSFRVLGLTTENLKLYIVKCVYV
jgi:hypothetical protein